MHQSREEFPEAHKVTMALNLPIMSKQTMSKFASIAIFGVHSMNATMNIGQAANAASVSAKMIRHYELIGLLPQANRSEAGYRLYGQHDVSVLRFIRQSRSLGFSIAQIGDLIGLWGNESRSSRDVKAMAQRHLADLQAKLHEMAAMKHNLEELIEACHGDDQPICAIINTLAIDSPVQPRHEAKVVKLPRRSDRAAHEEQPSKSAASSSHLDLMAWIRSVHAAPHQRSQIKRGRPVTDNS
jgi:Cu(I)-responsive transcriptional regulator